MNVVAFLVLILNVLKRVHCWPLEFNFFDTNTQKISTLFDGQKYFHDAFDSSYKEAVKIGNSMYDYLDSQQEAISAGINDIAKSARERGKEVLDSWSHLPVEEPGAILDNPDLVLSVPSIITRNGYTCETHTVISQGYLINVHRIPRSKNGHITPKKTVLLQHGLFASSADWILNGPEKGLAYVLADAGYDVWMSNIRGNRYSKEHAWLKRDSKSYWNFSWHDVAVHDIPAVIDYIKNIKDEDTKITYIGHSMGTTILFAMLTSRPEYNEVLTAAIALSPVVFLKEIRSPLKNIAPAIGNIAAMEMLYGSYELIPKTSVLGRMTSSCDVDNVDTMVCKNIIFYLCGYNEKQFNKTLLPVFLSNLGTGTSWKTAVHFAQEIINDGKFQQFDYGVHNRRIYNSDTPPEYDLSLIKLPLSLFWSENDLLSSESDVRMLHEKLPKTTEMYKVPDPEFNHIDYLWGKDAPTLVNSQVLQYLGKVYTHE